MGTYKAERKLSKAVDELLGEMVASYMPALSEGEKIEMNLGGAKQRDDVVEGVKEQLRCWILSVMSHRAHGSEMEYELQTLVSSDYLRTKLVGQRVSK